ncbi:MAG: dual OB domain-containing protein [Bacillota bacterium]
MPTKRIICLANSRKHGQRCVAGIDWANNTWVRFVKDGRRGINYKGYCFSKMKNNQNY